MSEDRTAASGPWEAFGSYLRSQRHLARLSLRDLAELTRVSNPYLSQIERGLHQPSIAVVKSLAEALNVSVEQLLAQAAGIVGGGTPGSTEAVIRADDRLSEAQKAALLAVYRSMVDDDGPHGDDLGATPGRSPKAPTQGAARTRRPTTKDKATPPRTRTPQTTGPSSRPNAPVSETPSTDPAKG